MKNPLESLPFFHRLCALPFVDAIWLYGSRARGEDRKTSDFDLALVCPQASGNDWLEVEKIVEEQEDTLIGIDCVRFDVLPLDHPLRLRILRDKVVLFENKPEITQPIWVQKLKNLEAALQRLEESLGNPVDPQRFMMDTVIQRFEFCIELFWKNFKSFAKIYGYDVLSPREALGCAFSLRWIDQEKLWLSMLKDRNVTSHNYNCWASDEVYARIHQYFPEMKKALGRLREVAATIEKQENS